MKNKKKWKILCIVLTLVLSLIVGILLKINQGLEIIEPMDIDTQLQNYSMEYDPVSDTFFVGTYNNVLLAYQDGEKLWELKAKGPFKKIVVKEEQGLLYAGNEDNHVYIINTETGEIVGDINVQRRIYDIDVNTTGTEIIVSAGVNTNKHNILVYSSEGQLVNNFSYKTRIQGIEYGRDDASILLINNRGELLEISKEGEEIKKFQTKYELVDVERTSEHTLALCIDGSYYVINDRFELVRHGVPVATSDVTAKAVSSDSEYIFVGTEEGNIYIYNGEDVPIYHYEAENSITDIMIQKGTVYVTGLGDFILRLKTNDLSMILALKKSEGILQILLFGVIFGILGCVYTLVPRFSVQVKKIIAILKKHRTAYLLLLPTFILLIFFNYTPVYIAFTRAFTNWSKDFNTLAEIKFVGVENFKLMFAEGYFLTGLSNLALLLFTGFLKILTVPIFVAWLVFSMKSDRIKYSLRFLFVLPMVVPGVVTALIWQQIYDPTIGLINQLLGTVGLENLQRVWLGDEKTAIWAIIFMGFPFINALAFLVYYGGFIDIDHSLFEAAKVDGARRFDVFSKIQIPMIFPQIKMMLVLTFIGVVQDFTSIYILTGGGPGTSTYVPGLELYYNATKFGRYGYACALGVVMFLFIMIGTIINLRMKSTYE